MGLEASKRAAIDRSLQAAGKENQRGIKQQPRIRRENGLE